MRQSICITSNDEIKRQLSIIIIISTLGAYVQQWTLIVTSTTGHRAPPSVTTGTGSVMLASSGYPALSPGHQSTLQRAYTRCAFQYATATLELNDSISRPASNVPRPLPLKFGDSLGYYYSELSIQAQNKEIEVKNTYEGLRYFKTRYGTVVKLGRRPNMTRFFFCLFLYRGCVYKIRVHTQPDPEQLSVSHTNICSVRRSNP